MRSWVAVSFFCGVNVCFVALSANRTHLITCAPRLFSILSVLPKFLLCKNSVPHAFSRYEASHRLMFMPVSHNPSLTHQVTTELLLPRQSVRFIETSLSLGDCDFCMAAFGRALRTATRPRDEGPSRRTFQGSLAATAWEYLDAAELHHWLQVFRRNILSKRRRHFLSSEVWLCAEEDVSSDHSGVLEVCLVERADVQGGFRLGFSLHF